jgi:hypothetical protein
MKGLSPALLISKQYYWLHHEDSQYLLKSRQGGPSVGVELGWTQVMVTKYIPYKSL